ncbi:class I SAM-dependent methyltransferase [Aestuariivirga litoralis]|nr:class I SAM-dependent methyltransferase [Aestuariivirga litoralis]MBG1230922.1 class I SAM-dependent methyltransferase [Aestuariivirga litoralis]
MSIVQKMIDGGIDKNIRFKQSFPSWTLQRVEKLLPASMEHTAETGCGKSTILFSNLSKRHTVFCLDDRKDEGSSVELFESSKHTKPKALDIIFGPSQVTLPQWAAGPGKDVKLDAVLIDGPHGFPFPELEYYYFYPRLKTGGILIIDDIHIPTVGQLADFIAEDAMFELVEVVATTAVFRRTDAPTFSPITDGWTVQHYNRRRLGNLQVYPGLRENGLEDGKRRKPFAETVGQSRSLIVRESVRVYLSKFFRRK